MQNIKIWKLVQLLYQVKVTPIESNKYWNLLENIGKRIPCLQSFKKRI